MHKLKQWYQDLNLQSKFTLVLLLIVSIPGIAIIFFFYGRAYDMVVSYTIRQEQDRSAETAPLIEESIPVSYTHLDVYKRQCLHRLRFTGIL